MADIGIAAVELALARRTLGRLSPAKLGLLHRAGTTELSARQQAVVRRVAFAVPIMGLRVPWRSDCIVQALAARRWLARHGIRSTLCLGVRSAPEPFAAHAWLKVGDELVTGGDVSSYAELPPAKVPRELFE